jgi:hypothetical protein
MFCMRIYIPTIAVIVLAGAAVSQTNRPPEQNLDPVIDNEYVRVFAIPPGVRGQPRVLRPIGKLDAIWIVELEGGASRKSKKAAPAVLLPEVRAVFSSPKNGGFLGFPVGDKQVLKSFCIELKSQPPPTPFALDAVKLDPQHNLVLFENGQVRVVRIHFDLGEKGPVVDKRTRVIILLSDMHAEVAKPGGAPEPRDGTAGTIYWSLGGSQATMNRNETKLDNIVVELKGK